MRWLPRRPSRHRAGAVARVVGVTVLLALVGWITGVTATTLFPTHVQTTYYQADVHLELVPTSTVSVPTVLGDVDIHFDGPVPAPGVIVNSQLRRGVLEAFGSGTPAISALRPSSDQIDQVTHDIVVGIAVRFVAGLLIADAATLLALRAWRARPRRLVGVAAGATVLAVIAPTFAGWQAYRADRVSNVATTSLLGYARANTDILGDLTHRSAEASRYVVSALALSNALQNKVVPESPDAPTALRVLFVSDIHGVDQYPLMKRIIGDEDIDVVVDSGDLINFGDEQEASVSGIFKGIRSLGVPYLFVAGNHDSSSPKDHRLLDALAAIPNVHLLQPNSDTYNEVVLAGVRFGGFNDPRYYGDGDPHKPQHQVNARNDFVAAFRGSPLPDVIVSHEPPAVDGIDASHSLLVSGHLHVPKLQDNKMTVGTFTGGGLFGARIARTADQGTEVQTGEYSFDIAEYDTTCALATLRRFTFRNIVQGHPSLDSAKVLNGSHIVEPPAGRTCGGSTTPQVTQMRDLRKFGGTPPNSQPTEPAATSGD